MVETEYGKYRVVYSFKKVDRLRHEERISKRGLVWEIEENEGMIEEINGWGC